jgi:hypothetical protein
MERTARTARLIEQHSLLGGVDLVRPSPGRSRAGQTIHVDPRWKVGFAAALALVVEHGRRARDTAELPRWTRCPRCQRVGDTVRDFGVRLVRGRRIPQSWCRSCRGVSGPLRLPRQADWLDH